MHWFQVLNLSEQDAVGPILINLLVRLRNLQVIIRNKLFGFAVLMP
jgi:maestro heat-like repeat-containing protein family member 1